jgi:hypothetical protein
VVFFDKEMKGTLHIDEGSGMRINNDEVGRLEKEN